jgi:hypothetical protein
MTIMDAINTVDNLKHNTYDQNDKVAWLSRLDHRVKTLIMDAHEGGRRSFSGYDQDTDGDTELLVRAPFDEMYLKWLEAQIDYHNGEYGKYNNSITVFNSLWQEYENHYRRTHMPKGQKIIYF